MISKHFICGFALWFLFSAVYDAASQLEENIPTTYRPSLNFLNINHPSLADLASAQIHRQMTREDKNNTQSYENDTVVNYVTIRPGNEEAEEIFVNAGSLEEDVIYVTTENAFIESNLKPEKEVLSENMAEDLPIGNIIARRLGHATSKPEMLNPRKENIEGNPQASIDAWKPVWPYKETSTTTSRTQVQSSISTDVIRYPSTSLQKSRFPVSKEPITAYYFDLSHSLLPTGGPLYEIPAMQSDFYPPFTSVTGTPVEFDYEGTSLPIVVNKSPAFQSEMIESQSTLVVAPSVTILSLESVRDPSFETFDELSVNVTPSDNSSPSQTFGNRVNTRLSPVPVNHIQADAISSSTAPNLEPSMADSSKGDFVMQGTISLINTPVIENKTSTQRSVNRITVDSRTPLWVRLSQKKTSSNHLVSTIVDKHYSKIHSSELVSTSVHMHKNGISSRAQSSELPSASHTGIYKTKSKNLYSRNNISSGSNIIFFTNTQSLSPNNSLGIDPIVSLVHTVISSVHTNELKTLQSSIPGSIPSDTSTTVPSSAETKLVQTTISSTADTPDIESFGPTDVASPPYTVSMLPSTAVVNSINPLVRSTANFTLESSLSDSYLSVETATIPTTTLPLLSTTKEENDEFFTTEMPKVDEDLGVLNKNDQHLTDGNETLTSLSGFLATEDTAVTFGTYSASPTELPDMISRIYAAVPEFPSNTQDNPNVKLSYDLFTPTLTVVTPRIKETIELVEKTRSVSSSWSPTTLVSHTSSMEQNIIDPANIQMITESYVKSASPTYMQTETRKVQTILKPTTENGQLELRIVEMHANGTNTTRISPYVKAAISYDPVEFCKHQSNIQSLLGEWVNRHLENGTDTPGYEVKIFSQPNCSSLSSSSSRDEDLFAGSTDLYFYVVDKGQMDPNVTLRYPRNPTRLEISKELEYLKAKILHLELVSALSSGEDLMLGEEAVGTSLVAITISLGLLSLFLIAGILAFIVIKKRRAADQANGRRCTPAANDAYSMDSVSMYYHSFKRKSKKRASNKSIKSYLNQGFDDPNGPSRLLNFAKLTHFITDVDSIYDEFTSIPSVSPNYDEVPRGVEDKNRYANVIPLPETRVSLKSNGKNTLEEYINANYIHGARNEAKYYIATQAPLDETVDDFWKMIWEQESKIIVMLTDFVERGIDKCADYLPPSETLDCHRVYGEFQVTLKSRDMREKYVVSHVQLKNLENNLVREVAHMWYTGWPHTGIPKEEKTFISFIFETRAIRKKLRSKGPIVVHCSPGTGRTGTFIACDVGMRQFDDSKSVDIPKTVFKIRRERSGAVQTKEQYSYIYRVTNLYAAKLMTGNLDLF